MFKRLSIFHKMLLAPLLASSLFGFYIGYIYYQQLISKEYIVSIKEMHYPVIKIANENVILLDNIIKSFKDSVGAMEKNWLLNSKKYKNDIYTNINELKTLGIEKKELDKLKQIFDTYYTQGYELSSLMIDESEDFTKIEFKNFQELRYEKFVDIINTTTKHDEKIFLFGVILGIFSLVLILFITIKISFSTKSSLTELLISVKNIANGNPDFSKRLKQDSKDELGMLVKQFNRFTDKLQKDYDELSIAKKEAEIANRTKSEFIANVSHEVRTPLNAVIGFSELLNKTEVTNKQKSYLESIESGGKTLLAIINDILDLSKIEAGKLDIQKEPVIIKNIVYDIKKIFKPKAKEKNIDIRLNISPNLPTYLILDEVRIRQVLFNIIGNALKFTNVGYIQVDLFSSQIDEMDNTLKLHIDIKDTGIGIAEDQQKKIFESFVQKDGQSNRKYGGTGLGLAICLKLIKMMDGDIKLQSSENVGSTFMITLDNVQIDKNNTKPLEEIDDTNFINKSTSIKIDQNIKSSFTDEFNTHILPLWDQASKGWSFEDTLEFAKALEELAIKYEQTDIIDFAKELKQNIDEFDIDKMEENLEEFNIFISDIKKEE